MSLVKKLLMVLSLFAVCSFAVEDETYIRNICDTLPHSKISFVILALDHVDEHTWKDNATLTASKDKKTTTFKSWKDLVPSTEKAAPTRIPVSIKAGCSETRNNTLYYAEWFQSKKAWSLNDEVDDYASVIFDIHGHKTETFDSTNAYNFLAMKRGGLPEDDDYTSGEFFVSKTYEFNFDWWYASIVTRKVSTFVRNDTTFTQTETNSTWALGMDSASAIQVAYKGVAKPIDATELEIKMWHGVLLDSLKKANTPAQNSSSSNSSSSAAGNSSASNFSSSVSSSSMEQGTSSAIPGSSSSTNSSSSVKNEEPSSEEKSSSSVSGGDVKPDSSTSNGNGGYASSSSEEAVPGNSADAIAGLRTAPVVNVRRDMRRLDGSRVKPGEKQPAGLYYVKDSNGRWTKEVVLP